MILFVSNNIFCLKNIIYLLNQKKFPITLDKTSKHFFELELYFDQNQLKIISLSKSMLFKLPISFETFFLELNNLFINRLITIGEIKYNPIKQSLNLKNNIINLNYIHNIIVTNLILNIDTGISKIFLYKLIWPLDKDIQINKLDTHITNLKNKVKNSLNVDLKIISSSGILKLFIN